LKSNTESTPASSSITFRYWTTCGFIISPFSDRYTSKGL